jgi:hypothetical protein
VVDALGAPVVDVHVYVWNSTETAFMTYGSTDSLGQVRFNLDNGTYKLRCRKASYSFTIPEIVIVAGDTSATITSTGASPTPPTGPSTCRVYDYFFMPDGITPMSEQPQDAVRIVSLPADYGGELHTGTVTRGTYDPLSGLLYWDLVQGCKVEFFISDFGKRVTKTIPALATARLTDLT